MTDRMTLHEILTPSCPLGSAHTLILDWVQEGTLFRVKQVDGYFLDVARELVIHRLCTTWIDDQSEYDRHWTYAGTDRSAFMAAVLAAVMWDGSDDTEPLGWNKNGQTQEWREPGSSQTWQDGGAVPTMVGRLDDESAWPPKV